jgi:acid stress-induced BolA-like protein IbaG/YrbA
MRPLGSVIPVPQDFHYHSMIAFYLYSMARMAVGHSGMVPVAGKPMNPASIKALIEQGLPDARAAVRGDDGVHFEADVVCPAFAGQPPLARHRMVYATLGEAMGGAIHALSLKTLTPDEAAARGVAIPAG